MEAAVVAQRAAYMRIYALISVPTSLWMIIETIMQASGDVMRPLLMTTIAKLVHMVIEPCLIFGWGLFPHMGINGAALTILVTEGIGMAAGPWFLLTGRTRLRLTLTDFHLDLNIIWHIVKIGIPAALLNFQTNLRSVVFMRLIAPFGTLAVAAHSLGSRVEQMIFLPTVGMGLAAAVLVGQNLGAHQLERAERSSWLAIGLVEVFMTIFSLVILLWAESIVRTFRSEPGLVEIASAFLRIAAAGYLGLGISTVLQNCINGAGDTLPPMLVTVLMIWLVQVPLAFFLPWATNLGVYGVRWAMVAGWVLAAVVYLIYFRPGEMEA